MNVVLWPASVLMKFVSQRTGEPIPRLIVFIEVPAPRKNSFDVGPFVSNEFGEVLVWQDGLTKVVANYCQQFPMDYSASLQECDSFVVVVSGYEELQERIRRAEQFYPREALRISELLGSSSNGRYSAATVVVGLPIDEQPIVISLSDTKEGT